MKIRLILTFITAFLLMGSKKTHAQNWVENSKIVASNRSNNATFGDSKSVDIFGDYAVVGNYKAIGYQGSAYVYKRDPLSCNWTEIQALTHSQLSLWDRFGFSVAINDNFILIGALTHELDASGNNPIPSAGAVFIYKKDVNGIWVFNQKVVASDRGTCGGLGQDVDIDGNRMIVGSYGNSIPLTQNSGAAYIYEYNGTWNQTQKLIASDRAINDQFGISVSISGTYAVVGSHYNDLDDMGLNPLSNSGAAYVFERNANAS